MHLDRYSEEFGFDCRTSAGHYCTSEQRGPERGDPAHHSAVRMPVAYSMLRRTRREKDDSYLGPPKSV